MASLNKVQIIGSIGRDPEVKYTPSGSSVARLSVATSEKWTDKATGEKKEKTEWHRVIVFGKQAENCGKFLKKGSSVYVEGKIQTTSYEKDGITRYNTDIVASEVQFLGSKPEFRGQNNHGNKTPWKNQNNGDEYPF